MTGTETNRYYQFLVDVPGDQTEAVFQALNQLGINQKPLEQVAHLEFWKGPNCHVLFGYDLDALAGSINGLLEEAGLTPGIDADRDHWGLETVADFLEMAATRFGWSGYRTEEPHWYGNPEEEWERTAREYPQLVEGANP